MRCRSMTQSALCAVGLRWGLTLAHVVVLGSGRLLLGGADLHPYDSAIPYAFPHRLLPAVGTSERCLHVDRACRVDSRKNSKHWEE